MRAKVGQDTERKALPQPTWRALLAAAGRETDIFRLEGEGRELKLLLKAVPTDPWKGAVPQRIDGRLWHGVSLVDRRHEEGEGYGG